MFAKSATVAGDATQPSLLQKREIAMERNPWKLKTSEVLAKLFGKTLTREVWEKPNGEEEEYGIIGQKDWITVFAITTDNKVVVVNEFKPGRRWFGDELPAGTPIEPGDTWDSIAKRALEQEAGFTAHELIKLGRYHMASRNSHTMVTMVLAKGCRKIGPQAPKESTEIEWRLVPLDQWIDHVKSGRIQEWSAALCTFLSLPYLRK